MSEPARRDTARVGDWLSFTDAPDPRALQGTFALLIVLDVTIRALGGQPIATGSLPGSAVTVTLVTCALAGVLRWDRMPWWAVAVLPLLDMVALSLQRLGDAASTAGLFIVLPAYWLARIFGRVGWVIVLGVGLLVVTVPGLVVNGVDPSSLSRGILIPLVGAWVAFATAGTFTKIGREQDAAEQRNADLAEAFDVIEHQRRVSDAILDTVDVGLLLLDSTGAYQAMNRRHADFMKLAYPEGHAGQAGQLGKVFGADGQHLVTREQMPTYRAMHGEEFDDCRIWVGDDPLTWRALSVSARTVRDDEGNFAGAALAYKDVTDFMRAMEVKNGFIASVSHELRTPLTSIRGYADLLMERDDLPEDAVRQLSVVIRNSERLGRLVADLLHSAQMDLGPVQVNRTRCDLALLVRDAVQAATPAASASQITLACETPERLLVMLDQDRIRQAIDNLVSNAIKYTPPQGQVDVRLRVDGRRIDLSVADTGIGIEAADRDRLFTRFFRSRHAEEQSIQGVGLGLSITKSIVESHGGRIEVDSEVGRGSTFRMRVPVDPADGL